ncbi:hypothetical protein CKM354_000358000 [Cercospora kikuchii]|uniref:Uncharacterized protein n=1 Tax=Cercospora kikuchii TaxID=84275 RepID=A0A9P3FF70_9PEZI|nr:uncharacterized protein CKM354_000358000 [Cercospora kikuchii]GIZ40230.1 hypothetical protein CKM354_000358000 [Cercospora kikuchii]
MVATFGSIGGFLGHLKKRLGHSTVAIQTIANVVRILFNDLFTTLDTSLSLLKTYARLHFHNLRFDNLTGTTLKLIKDNPGTATKTLITAFPILFPKLSWTLVLSIVGLSTHGPTVGGLFVSLENAISTPLPMKMIQSAALGAGRGQVAMKCIVRSVSILGKAVVLGMRITNETMGGSVG